MPPSTDGFSTTTRVLTSFSPAVIWDATTLPFIWATATQLNDLPRKWNMTSPLCYAPTMVAVPTENLPLKWEADSILGHVKAERIGTLGKMESPMTERL